MVYRRRLNKLLINDIYLALIKKILKFQNDVIYQVRGLPFIRMDI